MTKQPSLDFEVRNLFREQGPGYLFVYLTEKYSFEDPVCSEERGNTVYEPRRMSGGIFSPEEERKRLEWIFLGEDSLGERGVLLEQVQSQEVWRIPYESIEDIRKFGDLDSSAS